MKKNRIRRYLAGIAAAALIFSGTGSAVPALAEESTAAYEDASLGEDEGLDSLTSEEGGDLDSSYDSEDEGSYDDSDMTDGSNEDGMPEGDPASEYTEEENIEDGGSEEWTEDTGDGEDTGSSEDTGDTGSGEEDPFSVVDSGEGEDQESGTDSFSVDDSESTGGGDSTGESVPSDGDVNFSSAESLINEAEQIVESTPSSAASTAEAATPDEFLTTSIMSATELPAFADATRAEGALRVTMDLKGKDQEAICVQGEPHLFVYLEQTQGSDGKLPEKPQEYTIRLTNLREGPDGFWTVSNRISRPVAGVYAVKYYTPLPGSEADCDKKVPSYVEAAPDDTLMYRIEPGEKFAGSTMTLSSESKTELNISATSTDDTKLELDAEATTRSSLTPGAYKKITGVESTKAQLGFELYSSNSDGDEGELLMTLGTDGEEITEKLGRGFFFEPVLMPAPGDYWFLIKEDNSGAAYFTPVAGSVYCHATVGYSGQGSDVLSVTGVEYFQGSVKNKETSRKLEVTSLDEVLLIKGDNEDVTGEAYYELYGPFEGHSAKREDDGTFGKPLDTKKGSSYTFYTKELVKDWYTYVIVERASKGGPENRDHLVQITARNTSEGVQWYIKDRASFTNKYAAAPVQQTFTIENVIKGKPTTAQTFTFRLRRISDNQIATVKVEANATKEKDIKLPSFTKAGTYEFHITELDEKTDDFTVPAGFSYNTENKTYKLKYVVKDDGKGKLIVTTYVDDKKVKDEKPVMTFNNKYALTLKIQHVDASSSKGVSGAKSRIVDKNGNVVKKTWKSDGNAKKVTITADGTYTIKEVKAPSGYQAAKDVQFTIKDGKVSTGTTIKIPHTKITGRITFKKVSSADTKKAVSNAEFYLYKIKYSEGTKEYNSAAANLKKGTIKWNQLAPWKRSTSQEDGTVTFTTLEPGTYYVIKENAITGQPYQLTPESKSAVISTKYNDQQLRVIDLEGYADEGHGLYAFVQRGAAERREAGTDQLSGHDD